MFCHTSAAHMVCWLLRQASWDDWQLFALKSAYERDLLAPMDARGKRAPLLPTMLQSPPKWSTFVPKHNTAEALLSRIKRGHRQSFIYIPQYHIFYVHPVVYWDKSSVDIFLSCSIFYQANNISSLPHVHQHLSIHCCLLAGQFFPPPALGTLAPITHPQAGLSQGCRCPTDGRDWARAISELGGISSH